MVRRKRRNKLIQKLNAVNTEVTEPIDEIKSQDLEDQDTNITEKLAQVGIEVDPEMQAEALRNDNETEEESSQAKEMLTLFDNKLLTLDKKVMKACSKVQRSSNSFKKEFNQEMTKVVQLQKVFNSVLISFESSREEQRDTASNFPLLDLPSIPPKDKSHPSKVAISLSEARILLEKTEKASFKVSLEEMPVLYQVAVCIQEYTDVELQCDFMDPNTGIYTVSVKGKYKFGVSSGTAKSIVNVLLCRDKDEERVNMSSVWVNLDHNGRYGSTMSWCCEVGDRVWLEVVGLKEGFKHILENLFFEAEKIT